MVASSSVSAWGQRGAGAAKAGQKGLGGDASPVNAGAANIMALDDCHLETLLPGMNGSAMAAHAASDNDKTKQMKKEKRGKGGSFEQSCHGGQ